MIQKGFVPILILVGVLVITTVAGGAYFIGRSSSPGPESSPTPVITSQFPKSSPLQNIQTPQPTVIPTPTPDPTINWQTINIEKCRFNLRYPTDWVVRTEPRKPPMGVVEMPAIVSGTDDESEVFCAWLYFPLPGINYNDFFKSQDNDFYIYINKKLKGSRVSNTVLNSPDDVIKTTLGKIDNIQDKNFNSLKGKFFVNNMRDDSRNGTLNFIFEQGKYIYHVLWTKSTNENYKGEIELIIQSINF